MIRTQKPFLGDLIRTALENGQDVTVSMADEYGVNIEVDGVPITQLAGSAEGMPWEMFEFPLGGLELADEAEKKIAELTNKGEAEQ